jgi:hypothetical protein
VSGPATPTDQWTAAQCRIARRLFHLLGEAGVAGHDAPVAIAFTEAAGQFAWHEELYFDLLPARVGVDRDALVAGGVRGADEVLDQLEALLAATRGAAACFLLARVVLARLHADVVTARAGTTRELDGTRARSLTLVARDLAELREAIELLAERAVAADGALDEANRVCADAETSLRAADVVVGLCPRRAGDP